MMSIHAGHPTFVVPSSRREAVKMAPLGWGYVSINAQLCQHCTDWVSRRLFAAAKRRVDFKTLRYATDYTTPATSDPDVDVKFTCDDKSSTDFIDWYSDTDVSDKNPNEVLEHDIPDNYTEYLHGHYMKITIKAIDIDGSNDNNNLPDDDSDDVLDIDGVSNGETGANEEDYYTIVVDLLNGNVLDADDAKDLSITVDNPQSYTQGQTIVADGWNAYGNDKLEPPYGENEGPTENPTQNAAYDVHLDFIITLL